MKQLVCEMCGSSDLVKDGGLFVCQTCGCKYTIEEARKMMTDGEPAVTTNTGSTVRVDTSGELANLYQIARRAKDDNNSENAAKYYDMILVKDPSSWEASFYVVYFNAMNCKIAQIRSAAISVANCQDSVLMLIRDHVSQDEQADAVKEMMLRSASIARMLANGAQSHYYDISTDIRSKYTQEYINNVCAARDIMYTCGSQIDSIFDDREEIAALAADAWKVGIELHKSILSMLADTAGNQRVIDGYVHRIGKYEPEYEKKYFYTQKKTALESEIAGLKRIITNTPTQPKWRGFGIFLLIVGCIILYPAFLMQSWGASPTMFYVCAVIFIVLGIICGVPKKSVTDANKKKVADAKEKLAVKEKELMELL